MSASATRLESLLSAVEDAPGSVDARRALAQHFYEQGELSRAAAELAKATELLLRAGQGAEAFRACRTVLALDPANVQHRLLMARVHARFPVDPSVRAVEPVEGVIELGPDHRLEEIELTDSLEMVALTPSDVTRPPLPETAVSGGGASVPAASALEDSGAWEPVSDADVVGAWPADDELGVFRAPTSASGSLSALGPRSDEFDGDERTDPSLDTRAVDDNSRSGFERRRSAIERFRGERPPERTEVGPAPAYVSRREVPDNRLFAHLTREATTRVFDAMKYVEYAAGAEIIAQAAPVERLVLVLTGECVAASHGRVFGPGTLVCAFELFGLVDAATSVVARVAVTTLEIDSASLAALRAEEPGVSEAFTSILRSLVLEGVFAESPILGLLSAEEAAALEDRFFTVSVGAGEAVLKSGEVQRRILVVLTGQLVVDARRSSGAQRVTLESGDLFAVGAALLGSPSPVTVLATAPSTLLALPEADVAHLINERPDLVAAANEQQSARIGEGIGIVSVARVGGPG